jgi:hypothetical protein
VVDTPDGGAGAPSGDGRPHDGPAPEVAR